jgi:multiple sugar transport system ATP-binding protein
VSFLELERLAKTYPDGTRAVRGIDLAIEARELVVLLGPSGCGKTTTLRMIAGLEMPSEGRILLGGREVTSARPSERDIGFVFQFYALYPHLSVAENIAFPLRSAGLGGSERRAAVTRVAERLGIEALLARRPRELSGGDQQRVALARAIVRKPSVYLMDEPLGTLDAEKRLELRELVRAQQLELGVATVYVTHDQEEAMSLADRIVVMRDGVILQVGSPREVYQHPSTLFVARFVGSPGMNLLPGKIESAGEGARFVPDGGGEPMTLRSSRAPGPTVLGIRPEFVRLDPAGFLRGKVAHSEFLGDSRCVHAKTECGTIVARTGASVRLERDAEVRLALDDAHAQWFDPATEARCA